MTLADLPIRRPVATLMFLVSLMVLGFVAIFRLPLDFMPAVEEPGIEIEVPFPGSHPLEGLRDIIKPIEEEVATIAGVKSIQAWSNAGSAHLEVLFDWSASLDVKKMEVREAVERARPLLPEEIGHIRITGESHGPGTGSVLHGRISAERDLGESWNLLDRRIKRPLERIKGVARVDLYGVMPQQVRIDLDLDALRRHGVQAREVIALINAASRDQDAGVIRTATTRYDVRSVTRFQSIQEIADLQLGKESLRVRDVARVEMREPRFDYGRHLDRKFAIGIDVYKEPTANTVDTVDRLLARIEEIEADPQLEGIKLLVWNNAGEEILSALRGLRNAGIFGGFLAVFVLFFFLRNLRTTLVVATSIPFSLLVTCGAMYLLGSEFNVLTLLGLMFGVGMLVDNGVVVIENIHRCKGIGMNREEAARTGAKQVALAVTASTATTVIVWSWLFVSERNELVIYLGAVALTICLAVGCSLLISLTFIPLCEARLSAVDPPKPGFVLRRLLPAYRRILTWTLRHRVITLTGLFLLASSVALPLMKIEKTGEPKMRQNSVPISYHAHDPVTKETMEGYVNIVEEWLFQRKGNLGFESVYSFYHERGNASTMVYLPKKEASPKSIQKLRRQIAGHLPVIPGVDLEVREEEWWRRRGRGGERIVSVALHGEDPEYLEEAAVEAERLLQGIPDSIEVYGPSNRGQREVRVRIDPDAARAVGVTPSAVANTVTFAFRGRQLQRYQGDDGEVDVIVGIPDEAQPGIDALKELPVQRMEGGVVPLSSAAEVTFGRTRRHIRREDRKTTQWVSVEFDEEKVTTEEAQERVSERMAGLKLPEGYSWDWGRWGRFRDEGLQTMLRGLLLSLLVVILLMAALFESLSQPFAIIVTLFLAFFGAFWALWLLGYDLDLVAFMGVVILVGIVVNNGIVMVDRVNQLRREGRERLDALVEGCGDRLRPVLMTAITTIFGLLPLALSGASVANAYIDSCAVAVIGGLTTSTLFTLLALPVWYTTVEDTWSLLLRSLPRRSANHPLGTNRGA